MGYHLYSLTDFDVRRLGKHDTYIFHFSLANWHVKPPSLSNDQIDADEVSRRFAEAIGSASISITTAINDLDGMFLVDAPTWLNPHAIWYSEFLVFCPTKAKAKEFVARVKGISGGRGLRAFYLGSQNRSSLPGNVEGIFVLAIPNGRGTSNIFNHLAQMTKTGITREFLRNLDIEGFSEALSNASKIKTFTFNNTVIVDVLGNAVLRESVDDLNERFERLEAALEKIDQAIREQRSDLLPTASELMSGWGEADTSFVTVSAHQAKQRLGEEALRELNLIRKGLGSIPKSTEVEQLIYEMSKVRRQMDAITKDKKPMTFEASLGFAMFGNGVRAVYKKDIQTEPVNRFSRLIRKLLLVDRLSGRDQAKIERQEELEQLPKPSDDKVN